MDNKENFYSGIQHVIGNQIERISNLEPLLLILHKNGVVSHKELSKQIGMTEEELEKNYRRIWILPFNSPLDNWYKFIRQNIPLNRCRH